jgi:membrane protein implicated in regulation of membrane protease activity
VPVAAISLFALVPSACRRVDVPLAELFRVSLWPALWPAVGAGAVLLATRSALPASLPAVALQLVIGAVVYFALFLVAVGDRGRREYLRQIGVLLKRTPDRLGRVGTANAS